MDILKSQSPLSNKICLCRKYKICIKSYFSYTTRLRVNTNQLKGDWQRYEKNPNAKPLPSVILIFQMWKLTLNIWRLHILSYCTKYFFFTFASFLLNFALFPPYKYRWPAYSIQLNSVMHKNINYTFGILDCTTTGSPELIFSNDRGSKS